MKNTQRLLLTKVGGSTSRKMTNHVLEIDVGLIENSFNALYRAAPSVRDAKAKFVGDF